MLLPKTNKTDSVSYFERVQGRLKYEKNYISFFSPFFFPVKKSLPSKHWVDAKMGAGEKAKKNMAYTKENLI